MQMLIQSTPLPYSLVKIRTLISYFPQLQGQLPNIDIFFLQSFFKYLFLYLLKHQILTGECLLLLTEKVLVFKHYLEILKTTAG